LKEGFQEVNDPVGKNIDSPVLEVEHCKLQSWDNSAYKRECPACKKGLLLVSRERKTLRLLEEDHCVLCGQRVKYTDIQQMREREGF
jgi:hypothetical protein